VLEEGRIHPEKLVIHVANTSNKAVKITSGRLWLAADPAAPRILSLQKTLNPIKLFNHQDMIPAGERGGFIVETDPLPLTYAAIEIVIVLHLLMVLRVLSGLIYASR